MVNPNLKGAVAEQAIVLAAVKLGIPVFAPVSEHGRVDLVLAAGGRLWRTQCKWGRLSKNRDVVMVKLETNRRNGEGFVRGTYTADEVDLFGVYSGELDRSFLLPASRVAGMREVYLRLTPARNGQQACINLAERFAFDGAIAQLGERVSGTHEVAGSSPASSTSTAASSAVISSEEYRCALGHWMERVAAGEEVLVTFRGKPRVRLTPVKAADPSANS